jgi:uncharacterized protein (TIGR00730 family)
MLSVTSTNPTRFTRLNYTSVRYAQGRDSAHTDPLPQTRSPRWVNKGLKVVQYLDNKLVPTTTYPFVKLFNRQATRQSISQALKGNPYSLSNVFYRLKYPRVLGVHVYGSARPSKTNSLAGMYQLGMDTGEALVKAGMFPVTGGGPGMMQAVAEGAVKANGHSVGVAVPGLDQENQQSNPYEVYRELVLSPTFTHRLKGPGGFYHRAGRVLVLPGGLGTTRELLEAFEELAYSDMLSHFPLQKQVVVLDNNGFFKQSLKPFLDKLIEEKVASPSIYNMIRIVPTLDEAIKALNDPSVPWTNGLQKHRHRNLKYKLFSLSALAERCFHALHVDKIRSKTPASK